MKVEEWKWRYLILVLDCSMTFGCFFNIDIISAVQADIQCQDTGNCQNITSNETCCEGCLGLGPDRYNQLYTAYFWMNALCALPGGYIIDRIGNRVSAVIVTTMASIGSLLFAVATMDGIQGTTAMFPLMICGRLLVGAGTGLSLIVQDRVVAFWFKDRISFVYGFVIFALRLGNVSNFLLTANVAKVYGIQWAFWLGTLTCVIGVLCAISLAIVDYYGTKQLDDDCKMNMKALPVSRKDIREFPASYWMVCLMLMSYYASYLPFVGNGTKYIQDRYGYSKTTSAYYNGAVYDISVLISPFVGSLLALINCHGMVLIATCVFTLPIFPLLAYCPEVHPLILTIWMGAAYTFAAVCLWPCIIIVVPRHAIGTAIGIATCIQGLGIGLTNLLTGKFLGFTEDPDMESLIHKYQKMLLLLLSLMLFCTLCSIVLNVFDLNRGRLLNRRLAKKVAKEMKNFVDEKSPLMTDAPSIQSYVSIDASVGDITPGIQ
ncbi:major facilitator superfamily domain-containing protein 1-like [Mizuhopecten yessoensis]|uniref:major facilitator superfamily domain-containing protein 1-like n=1 Tax=Mizuhopecten yessoensis TaxID=6573 RepID=UPI000B4581E8|nr:major facilitator superfamily domain-containing protein 1-like [Mizuhopecten yessoensis]XP_021348061.1 major facilitator superfamily domain-containing protein 1-like [Mizuhopecten yessoensis]